MLSKLIAGYLPKGETLPEPPASPPTIAGPRFTLDDESVSLIDAPPALSQPHISLLPRSMETYGQSYGLVLYRKKFETAGKGKLDINNVHDYADGKLLDALDRRLGQHTIDVDLAAGSTLKLIMENMGRTNIGDGMASDYKGIAYGVKLAGTDLTTYPLPLDNLHYAKSSYWR